MPFPVRAPFRVRADLTRLSDDRAVPNELDPGTATVFRGDRTWPALLADRLDALEGRPADVRAVDPGVASETLHAAGLALARHASTEVGGRVLVEVDVVRLPSLGVGIDASGGVHVDDGTARPWLPDGAQQRAVAILSDRPAHLRRLEAVALALQEDLVLIGTRAAAAFAIGAPGSAKGAGDTPAAGRVAWLHVAFPSGWNPGAMAGASFERLHAPVPDADALRRAGPALIEAMVAKGPFVRYVWGISPDGTRSRHPSHARTMPDDHPIERAWLRVERQTTLPLAAVGMAVFAIGVHVTPLTEALHSADRRTAFVDAVASLTPAARRYKGVPWSEPCVRRWCRAVG